MKKRVSQLTVTLLLAVFVAAFGVMPVQATFTPSPARTVVSTLPDANAPDAPEVVTVEDEDGEQTLYVREEDPENEGEYTYVPEDEVPLAEGDGNGDAENVSAAGSSKISPIVIGVAAVGTVAVVGGVAATVVGGGAGAAAAGSAAAGSAAGSGTVGGKILAFFKRLFGSKK